MRSSIVTKLMLLVCLSLSGLSLHAQDNAAPPKTRMPLVRAGIYYGRTGISTGPGGYLEINPVRWLGFCGFVSDSRTTHAIDGGTARVSDLSVGGCVTVHLPEIKKFQISPFVQRANQNNHNRIAMPQDDGTVYHDGDNEMRHIWTAGASIDRAIVKDGPRWVVRIGRNMGSGPSVENAGGLYFVGGIIFPLDRPAELGNSLRRLVGWKPPKPDLAASASK